MAREEVKVCMEEGGVVGDGCEGDLRSQLVMVAKRVNAITLASKCQNSVSKHFAKSNEPQRH